jgi:excisionase family DNA binding protein
MFDDYPDVVTVENLMEMLNIGKTSAYSLLQGNHIHHVRVGRKYIIPKKSVIGFLDSFCYNEDRIINGRLTKTGKETL